MADKKKKALKRALLGASAAAIGASWAAPFQATKSFRLFLNSLPDVPNMFLTAEDFLDWKRFYGDDQLYSYMRRPLRALVGIGKKYTTQAAPRVIKAYEDLWKHVQKKLHRARIFKYAPVLPIIGTVTAAMAPAEKKRDKILKWLLIGGSLASLYPTIKLRRFVKKAIPEALASGEELMGDFLSRVKSILKQLSG